MSDWITLDLGGAIFGDFGAAPFGRLNEAGHIVSNGGWPDFWFVPFPTVTSTRSVEIEITYAATTATRSWAYSRAEDTLASYQAAAFYEWAASAGDANVIQTLLCTAVDDQGPNALAAGESRITIESDHSGEVVGIRYRTIGDDPDPVDPPPVEEPSRWTTPIRLTREDPFADGSEAYNLLQGDVCVLNDGLAVAFASDGSFMLTWAIDVSGSTPRVGPMTDFFAGGSDLDYYPALKFDDPYVGAIYNYAIIVRVTDTSFALVGRGYRKFKPDGTDWQYGDDNSLLNYHAVSFFDVNPETLAVTRSRVHLAPYDSGFYTDDPFMAPWKDGKVVVVDGNYYTFGIFGDDGSQRFITIPEGTFSTSQVLRFAAVHGDYLFVLALLGSPEQYVVVRIDLNDESLIHSDPLPILADHNDYGWQVTTAPDGTLILLVTDGDGDQYTPLHIATVDPGTLTVTSEAFVTASADHYGSTSGWFGMVRSVDTWPDGTIVGGYVAGADYLMHMATVKDGVVLNDEQLPFTPAITTYTFVARMKTLGQDRAVAVDMRQVYGDDASADTFGLWFSMIPAPPGFLVGWWDSTTGTIVPVGAFDATEAM